MRKVYGIACYIIAMHFKVIQTSILVEELGFFFNGNNLNSPSELFFSSQFFK